MISAMNNINLLKIAYSANIVILVPVCFSMFVDGGTTQVFNGLVEDSAGLRLMIASLWTAILLGSAVGLAYPSAMRIILPIQIVYKSIWLLTFVVPRLKSSGTAGVPVGISVVFLLIVVTYPFIFWLGTR
jgi:hypothetical protein